MGAGVSDRVRAGDGGDIILVDIVNAALEGDAIDDEEGTVAGLYGTVTDIDDKIVTIEVAPGVTNRYARQAIGQVIKSDQPAGPKSETAASDVVDPD